MKKIYIGLAVVLSLLILHIAENFIVKSEDVGPDVWCAKIYTDQRFRPNRMNFFVPLKDIQNGGTKGKCYAYGDDVIAVSLYPKTEEDWKKWAIFRNKDIVFKGKIEVLVNPLTQKKTYSLKNPEFVRRKHFLDCRYF